MPWDKDSFELSRDLDDKAVMGELYALAGPLHLM